MPHKRACPLEYFTSSSAACSPGAGAEDGPAPRRLRRRAPLGMPRPPAPLVAGLQREGVLSRLSSSPAPSPCTKQSMGEGQLRLGRSPTLQESLGPQRLWHWHKQPTWDWEPSGRPAGRSRP